MKKKKKHGNNEKNDTIKKIKIKEQMKIVLAQYLEIFSNFIFRQNL